VNIPFMGFVMNMIVRYTKQMGKKIYPKTLLFT